MISNIKNLILRLLVKKGLVYVDENNIPVKQKSSGIVILAKNTYFESHRSFPFSSLTDIRNAVRSDIAEYSPIETDFFFVRKINEIEGKTKVNLWFVKKQISSVVNKMHPILVLPETYVFAFSQEKRPLFFNVTKENKKKLIVYIDQMSCITSMEIKSGSNIIKEFSRICDKPDDLEEEIISGSQDLKWYLKKGLFNMPFHEALKFINKTTYDAGPVLKTGLRYLYIGMLILFFYIGSSAFLIHQKKSELERQDRQISQKVAPFMEKRMYLEKEAARLRLFQSMVEGYQPKTGLIQVIMKTVPKGSLIQKFNISGHTLVIEGSAIDASGFIEALAKRPDMRDPRFTSPLVRNKKTGREQFKLIVEYTLSQNGESE